MILSPTGKLIILAIGAVIFVLLIILQLIRFLFDGFDDWMLKRRIERNRRKEEESTK